MTSVFQGVFLQNNNHLAVKNYDRCFAKISMKPRGCSLYSINSIYIFDIYLFIYSLEFFTSVLADGFSLEFE